MKNRKAFTLVELLVVIAILGILATVSIVGYSSFTTSAVERNAQDELSQFKSVLVNGDLLDNHYEISKDGLSFEIKTAADNTTNPVTPAVYYSYSDVLVDAKEDVLKLKGEFSQLVDEGYVTHIYYSYTKSNKTAIACWDLTTGSVSIVKSIPTTGVTAITFSFAS